MRQPVLTPCCKLFLRLAFCCFYYYNHTHRLAWKTLPLCLTVNYSAFVQLMEREFFPAHLWREEINTPLPKAGHSWRRFARPRTLSLYFPTASSSLFCLWTLVSNRFSLSDSIKEIGMQTPTTSLLWDIGLPSQSAGFWMKSCSLPSCLLDLLV